MADIKFGVWGLETHLRSQGIRRTLFPPSLVQETDDVPLAREEPCHEAPCLLERARSRSICVP